MFGLLSSDSQEVIERNEVIRRVREWNPGFDPECLGTLFEVKKKMVEAARIRSTFYPIPPGSEQGELRAVQQLGGLQPPCPRPLRMAAFSRLKHDPQVLHILTFKGELNSGTYGNIFNSRTFSSHSARLDVAPTFYQTLAGVTHLEEQEIAELEKRFWALAQDSSSGLIDRFDSLN